MVLTDSVAYCLGGRVRVMIRAPRGGKAVLLRDGEVVDEWPLSGGFSVREFDARRVGTYIVRVEAGGRVETSKFIVLERPEEPPRIAIVFHDHQAPNYSPDGSVREGWAFEHTWNDEFRPYYVGGAYYVQAELLSKWRVKLSANLSPSLLKQWSDLLNRGVVIDRGGFYECVEPDDERAGRVREALERFRALAREGVLEVLTSFYSHPLAGYIADSYGWLDLLREELRVGREVTEEVMGVEPRGAWLPEMSFSMKLLPILEEGGIEYVVLDGISHYTGAVGEKEGIYRLYKIGELAVFFRHTALSDLWSFKYSGVKSPEEAEAGARDLVLRMVVDAYVNRAEVLTVALDGENWMILPAPKPATAVLLDLLLGYLKRAEEQGLVRLVKLCEVVEEVEPLRLVSIPSRSWRGGYDKWVSERSSVQHRIWRNVVEAYEYFKALEHSVGAEEEDLLSLMHAVNSDHIWAEFADEEFSAEWSRALRGKLEGVLSSIKIAGVQGRSIRVVNVHGKPIRVLVYMDGAAGHLELRPGLNTLKAGGGLVRIVIRGWRREYPVGKPLLLRAREGPR